MNNTLTPEEVTQNAIADSSAGADEQWKKICLNCIKWICSVLPEFTSDDVEYAMTKYYPDVKTHDTRARGALMLQAAKNGWCSTTMTFKKSIRKEAHSNPKRVWQSHLYDASKIRIVEDSPEKP